MTNGLTVELTMLLYSVILFFILIAIPATESILKNGLEAQAGARDSLPEPTTFNKRAVRLRNNLAENLLIFAPLILIAHAAGISTGNTILGAQMFFFARVAHAVIYLAGWPWIRPLAWFIGVVGCIMIALALL